MKDYQIVAGIGRDWTEASFNLEDEVNEALRDGYKICGGPLILSTAPQDFTIGQAVVKE